MGRKRHTGRVLFAVLLVVTIGLGYGVSWASGGFGSRTPAVEAPVADPGVTSEGASTPSSPTGTPTPSPTPTPTPSPTPTPTPSPSPTPTAPAPGPKLLGPGDDGDQVRDLQVRLRQLYWYSGTISGRYDARTKAAVDGFQGKRGFARTGVVDQRTLKRLGSMSTTPSEAEKQNKVGSSWTTDAPLDARCKTGRAICIDKTSRTLRWVVDGQVQATMQVRFGASYSPTREGVFAIQRKAAQHVSTLYDSSMPYSQFFSGGQAVHYSSDFAARGYAGASHGCVNVRDLVGVRWLFGQTRIGDRVVVYRS